MFGPFLKVLWPSRGDFWGNFDPKMAKTRVFPDTTLSFDDSKQLSTVSDQVLDKSEVLFGRKGPKT